MQTAIALPESPVIIDRRKPAMRPMTYQVAYCGSDGIVIASDRLEGQQRPDGTIARGNEITKLRLSGEFAWAFSGGELAKIFAGHLGEKEKELSGLNDARLIEIFRECQWSAFKQWGQPGPDSTSRVLFVCGSSKSIFRINPLPHTEPDRFSELDVTGQVTNTASFLSRCIYSPEMSVKALLRLAAYSIRVANFFDSSAIDGLDMAVYTKTEPSFQPVDAKPYLDCRPEIEREIRRIFEK